MHCPGKLLVSALFWSLALPASALPPTSDMFDDIVIGGSQKYDLPASDIAIAEIQVLLDRAGFSPGVIDGKRTSRFDKALKSYNAANPDDALVIGRKPKGKRPVFIDYEITPDDVNQTYIPELPVLYVDMTQYSWLGYRGVREMIAERFHIDEDYLVTLNPDADFTKPGTIITVPDIGRDLQTRVHRIEADKTEREVRAFDANDKLVARYPASIGSANTPSPSGTHTVVNKAQDPQYTYDPSGSAQPGMSSGLVVLAPGPNGPVGNAWIGLSKKTYGIHGTPEPSMVGIAESVGCIRLTNWDALELARLVRTGVRVEFID